MESQLGQVVRRQMGHPSAPLQKSCLPLRAGTSYGRNAHLKDPEAICFISRRVNNTHVPYKPKKSHMVQSS